MTFDTSLSPLLLVSPLLHSQLELFVLSISIIPSHRTPYFITDVGWKLDSSVSHSLLLGPYTVFLFW